MKITFETLVEQDEEDEFDCGRQAHTVLMDGTEIMSQAEGIEPEDAFFGRDLCSPHECMHLIKEVIKAVKRGDAVEIEEVTKDW